MTFVSVMPAEELWTGEMRSVKLAGHRILLLRLEDGVRAYEDRCAHLGVPLSMGTLQGVTLTCGAHHYQYDARTGAGINPRATQLVQLRTCVADGAIQVDVDPVQGVRARGDQP